MFNSPLKSKVLLLISFCIETTFYHLKINTDYLDLNDSKLINDSYRLTEKLGDRMQELNASVITGILTFKFLVQSPLSTSSD